MSIVYLNGEFLKQEKASISPDDRGFLFADSVYEVVRWYGSFFFDMEGHMERLKRSLRETRISWKGVDTFPETAKELVTRNDIGADCSLVYLQVTRGAAPRTHAFPDPPVEPTVYAFARRVSIDTLAAERGISLSMATDPRWSRCDIKSTALLANILAYQQAHDDGNAEVLFVRDGYITEAGHSNIFLVKDEAIHTHPESQLILSGITRANVIRVAKDNDIVVVEEPVPADMLPYYSEVFITNTSGEVLPVTKIGGQAIGDGHPGPVTRKLQRLFREMIDRLSIL